MGGELTLILAKAQEQTCGRGHHYGWGRGRGHHYGWRHHRHHWYLTSMSSGGPLQLAASFMSSQD
jgi:hypothetical protein